MKKDNLEYSPWFQTTQYFKYFFILEATTEEENSINKSQPDFNKHSADY